MSYLHYYPDASLRRLYHSSVVILIGEIAFEVSPQRYRTFTKDRNCVYCVNASFGSRQTYVYIRHTVHLYQHYL